MVTNSLAIQDAINPVQIYLDLCCFNRPYDDQSQVRIHLETEAIILLQERIKLGELV